MFLVKMYEQESRNKREQGPIYIVTVTQHSRAGWVVWLGVGVACEKKTCFYLFAHVLPRQASGRVTIQTIKHDFATQ